MNSTLVRTLRLLGLTALGILALGLRSAQAGNWPQWRGPDEDGTSRETNLPFQWSDADGLAWKCDLPEWGDSTPAIWDDAVFLTSQVEEQGLVLVKIRKSSGRIEWTRQVGSGTLERATKAKKPSTDRGKPTKDRGHQIFHNTHNMASPSPVTDGELVVVHFGNGDLAAYDFAGRQLWRRNMQEEHGPYTIWWGHANSPVLYGDLVICACLQDSLGDLRDQRSPSYLVAYDKRTGEQRWKTKRMTSASAEDCDAYTTPVFWRHGDAVQMIVMGGRMLDGYDPATGRQLWALSDLEGSRVITGPVVAHDMIFATQGKRAPLLAVKLGGAGQRPATDIVWKNDQATPDSPTPTPWGQHLFVVADNGIATCLDLPSGREQWKERLPGAYRASPLAADGRIYFLNMEGCCTVVAAADHFQRLAENRLSDATIASPAVSDARLFIRGHKALYCVGKGQRSGVGEQISNRKSQISNP